MQNHNFTISDNAANRIKEILIKENAFAFRVAVNGGGCSGFQYEFDFANSQNEDDILISQDDAKIVIDEVSIPFLENAKLDWVEDILGASFRIKNPNAKSSCGCGVSFSV